jgi:Na+/melibiose symporter-like transporter
MKTKKEKSKNKLGFGKMLLWQSRSISQAANLLILGFLTIYCTDTLKMPAALVGTLLMASKIFDGFTDLVAGYIVDKTNTKLGRGRPYELSIIGLWFCTWLMFSCPPEFSLVAKSVWILAMYSFANAIFATFLNANGNVYMVRAFASQEHYVTLSSIGGIFVMLGAIVINVSFPMLMATMATSAQGWSTLITIYAVPLLLIGILRFFTIKETNNVDVLSNEKIVVKDAITVLKTNPYIYIIALMMFVSSFVGNMGISQYYFTYVVKNIGLMGPISLTTVIILPVAIAFPPLIKKFSTTKLITAGISILCVGFLINFFARDNVLLIIIGGLLTGLGSVPISMLSGLMIIDCAEYNEWKNKPRLEGTLSSLTGFAGKVGAGFGTGLVGVLLGVSGYTGSAATMPASAITMIRMLNSLIPMALYVLIVIVLKFYKLDKLMPQIRKENVERRNALTQSEGNMKEMQGQLVLEQ